MKFNQRISSFLFILSFTLLSFFPSLLQAACGLPHGDCQVRTENDKGQGSLRLLIEEACNTAGDDKLEFNRFPGDVGITLNSPLVIPANCQGKIEIAGLHGAKVVISGSGMEDNKCALQVQSNNNLIHHLYFIESPKGICVQGSGNQVSDNFVGFLPGISPENRGNDVGVYVTGNNNQIFNNEISNNKNAGVHVSGGSNNLIQANSIGTRPDNSNLGNQGAGIFLDNGASSNLIGGTVNAQRNYIKFNHTGVALDGDSTIKNVIRGNNISFNIGLGIDLEADGLPETSNQQVGANHRIAFPKITSVPAVEGNNPTQWFIVGKGKPGAVLEIFKVASGETDDSSNHGEGALKLTHVTVPQGGNFSVLISAGVAMNDRVSATYTTSKEGTSEFSANVKLTDRPDPNITDTPCDPATDKDCDDIPDNQDNCPNNANPDQKDGDGDGKGDVCDNCKDKPNADQLNSDADSLGDACDNCKDISNEDQKDTNSNGIGDVCETTTVNVPTELEATAVSSSQINVKWTDKANNETGFELERANGACALGNPFAKIQDLPVNTSTYNDVGLNPSRTFCYRVRAVAGAVNSDYSNKDDATTLPGSDPAPSDPTNLQANGISISEILVIWTNTANNETGFELERANGACDAGNAFVKIQDLPANTTSFTDPGLPNSTTFCYRVRAVNNATPSGYSNRDDGTTLTPGTNVPSDPTQLTADATGPNSIEVKWTDNANNEDGYMVERADGACAATSQFAVIGQVATGAGTGSQMIYTDNSVNPASTYCYRVRAFNGGGNSNYSNMDDATTPAEGPDAPDDLNADPTSPTSVTVTWTDDSSDEDGFDVERADGPCTSNSVYTVIGTVGAAPGTGTQVVYVDNTVQPGQTYCYRVKVKNPNGSSYSNSDDATTPNPSDNPPGPVDTDKDGIPDNSDNCVTTPNTDQLDSDKDGIGDVCDADAAINPDKGISTVDLLSGGGCSMGLANQASSNSYLLLSLTIPLLWMRLRIRLK